MIRISTLTHSSDVEHPTGLRVLPARQRIEQSQPRPTPRVYRGYWHTTRMICELLRPADMTVALVTFLSVVFVANAPQLVNGFEQFLLVRLSLKNILLLGGFVVLWPIIFASFGLYNPEQLKTPEDEVLRVLGASALVSLSTLFVLLNDSGGEWGIYIIPLLWIFTAGGLLVMRHLTRLAFAISRAGKPRQVLIVGSGPRAFRLYRDLCTDPRAHREVIGFVDTNDFVTQKEIRQHFLGTLDELESILMHRVVDEVLIALPIKSCYQQIQESITTCERVGVEAQYLADVFQNTVARPRYEHSAHAPVVALKVVQDDLRMVVKRAGDILGAAIGLVVLAPAFLAIAVVIKFTSPGPVFFSQRRYGINKRLFRMYKFRTMVANAEALQIEIEHLNEAQGPVFKIKDDPRITPIGRFLRRTSLDELPQLFNVLRGEMSLVGPRPLPMRDVHRFTESWLMRRFSVVPGCTCLWQISGRSNLGFDDWVDLDLRYIDHWSLRLDVKILLKTIPVVLRGTGAS